MESHDADNGVLKDAFPAQCSLDSTQDALVVQLAFFFPFFFFFWYDVAVAQASFNSTRGDNDIAAKTEYDRRFPIFGHQPRASLTTPQGFVFGVGGVPLGPES